MNGRRVESIDGVVEELEKVIAWALGEKSRIGYFASLYLRVTLTIKGKIGTGYFDDDARLEQLDVSFANRYFEALEQFREGDAVLCSDSRRARI